MSKKPSVTILIESWRRTKDFNSYWYKLSRHKWQSNGYLNFQFTWLLFLHYLRKRNKCNMS